MKKVTKQYCPDCENPIDECTCNEEEGCPFCENIHDILERIDEADYDEAFGILHSAFSDCAEQCYKQGYVEALRTESELLVKLADDLENEDE